MPTLDEQNQGKQKLADKNAVKLMWAEYDKPNILALLSKYAVHEPISFELNAEAQDFAQAELEKLEKAIAAEKDATAKKALKKDLAFKVKALAVLALNPAKDPLSFYEKYMDLICWTVLAQIFNFNLKPEIVNIAKDQILYTTLLQNKSWDEANPDSPLGEVKAYITMLAENHPEKDSNKFVLKTIAEIESGK